ncbi:MAG: hypothetical protein HC905_12325 [Bacteroidales bacterium]|nr:hypothetical protein [Bacteroidales bacterium]
MITKVSIKKSGLLSIIAVLFCIANISATGSDSIPGIKNPFILLNGTWKINLMPENNFHEKSINLDSWTSVHVPGEPAMQGHKVQYDKPFVYKKK